MRARHATGGQPESREVAAGPPPCAWLAGSAPLPKVRVNVKAEGDLATLTVCDPCGRRSCGRASACHALAAAGSRRSCRSPSNPGDLPLFCPSLSRRLRGAARAVPGRGYGRRRRPRFDGPLSDPCQGALIKVAVGGFLEFWNVSVRALPRMRAGCPSPRSALFCHCFPRARGRPPHASTAPTCLCVPALPRCAEHATTARTRPNRRTHKRLHAPPARLPAALGERPGHALALHPKQTATRRQHTVQPARHTRPPVKRKRPPTPTPTTTTRRICVRRCALRVPGETSSPP